VESSWQSAGSGSGEKKLPGKPAMRGVHAARRCNLAARCSMAYARKIQLEMQESYFFLVAKVLCTVCASCTGMGANNKKHGQIYSFESAL